MGSLVPVLAIQYTVLAIHRNSTRTCLDDSGMYKLTILFLHFFLLRILTAHIKFQLMISATPTIYIMHMKPVANLKKG